MKRYYDWCPPDTLATEDSYRAFKVVFSGSRWDALAGKYVANPMNGFPKESDVILAFNAPESYEESCVVVFRRDGQIVVSEVGHCSCNGYDECDITSGTSMSIDDFKKLKRPYFVPESVWKDAIVDASKE